MKNYIFAYIKAQRKEDGMAFYIMALLTAAAVTCGVNTRRRTGTKLRGDVCLWLTRVHLAVLALAIAAIIFEYYTDFQLRWNVTHNSMLLAWLTGVVAFFVGIRTEKTRAVKLYLRIFLAFAILCLPIIFFAAFSWTAYYATSEHYTVCIGKGFLSPWYPKFEIRKTYWIVECPFTTTSNSIFEPDFYDNAQFSLTEEENAGALVFTATDKKRNGESCTIIMTDTAKYRRNARQAYMLITDRFKRASGFKNYHFECTLPENGWKVELASDYENTISSPKDAKNRIRQYSSTLSDNDNKDSISVDYSVSSIMGSYDIIVSNETKARLTIPKDSFPRLTPYTAVDEITSLFVKYKDKVKY